MLEKPLQIALALALVLIPLAALAGELTDADLSAAEKGDPAAQFKVFEAYLEKEGCDYFGKGMDWLRKSAESGYPPAQTRYGAYLIAGNDRENRQKGQALLELSAAQGDADAEYWLGIHLLNNATDGDARREAKAWLEKAARRGHGEAARKLRDIAETAISQTGVVEEYMAAEAGDTGKQIKIARRYALGDGVEQNLDEAARWCARAAEEGLTTAGWKRGQPERLGSVGFRGNDLLQ